MELYAPVTTVEALQQGLAASSGAARIDKLVALAWHLRQRDGAQALQRADEAAALIAETKAARTAVRDWTARLALARCEVAALRGDVQAAEDGLAQAREPGKGEPTLAPDACLAEALLAKASGQRDRELQAYERCVRLLSRRGDRARVAAARAWLAYERCFAKPARTQDELAFDAASDPAAQTLLCAAQGLLQSRRNPGLAAQLFMRASEQAREFGLLRHAVVCRLNAGAAWQGLGDMDQAEGCFEVAERVTRHGEWRPLLGSVLTKRGAYLSERGRLDEARELLEQAVALCPSSGGINRGNACSELARVLMRMGRATDALAPMAEAIATYRSAHSTDNLALNLIHQARLLSNAGQPKAAMAAIAEAQALIDAHGLSALQVGIHETLADIHLHHALPGPKTPGGMATAALYHSEAALREGRALAGWRAPSWLLTSLADQWAAAGDPARALVHAREALEVLEEQAAMARGNPVHPAPRRRTDDPGAATDADALWRASRTASAEGKAACLTPKELQVLRLLAHGYSNKEIAGTLALGTETVKWHLKKLYDKLEVSSRRQAVARAMALGVVPYAA
jgi:ATP/maltotriose-dependent transcriptional regulator MalT